MNTASTAFRLLVILCVLVMILLSLMSFAFISPRRTYHATPVNLNAPSLKPKDPNYLAICVPMNKDLSTLPEFLIHHYYHVGIRKFYIVDQSVTGYIRSKYHELPIKDSYITWLRAPPKPGNESSQFSAYDLCQTRYGNVHTWIAYLDVDEFIEQRMRDMKLQDFLFWQDKNSTVGAVGINVLLHTSNGHLLKTENGYRKNYTECVSSDMENSPNAHIKSIVKTKYYDRPRTDHNFITKGNSITIGEKGDKVPFIFRKPITIDYFAIHHYALRSREEFNIRIKHGDVEEPKTYPDMMDWWWAVAHMPKMRCDSMVGFNP